MSNVIFKKIANINSTKELKEKISRVKVHRVFDGFEVNQISSIEKIEFAITLDGPTLQMVLVPDSWTLSGKMFIKTSCKNVPQQRYLAKAIENIEKCFNLKKVSEENA